MSKSDNKRTTKAGFWTWTLTGAISLLSAISYRSLCPVRHIQETQDHIRPALYLAKRFLQIFPLFVSVAGVVSLAICWIASKYGLTIRGGELPSIFATIIIASIYVAAIAIAL